MSGAVWAIFWPLLVALAEYLLQGRARWPLRLAGVAGTVWALALLTRMVVVDGVGVHALGGWPAPLGIELYADGLAVLMLWLSAVVMAVSVPYAGAWFGDQARARHYWPLWWVLWSALNGLFLSADLFNLYVMLELLTLAAVPLVALAAKPEALAAALRYLLFALLGSLAWLLGVAVIYAGAGTLHLHGVPELAGAPYGALAAGLITAGLFAKAALFPLHAWLPPAHGHAPAPVSAILSALVVKAAVYLVLRIWLWGFPDLITPLAGQLLGLLGAAAMILGSVWAFRQAQLKQVIAYSTVAQLGYLLLIFPLLASAAAWQGVVYHGLAHGLAKAALFLAAGNIMIVIGHDRLRDMRNFPSTLSPSLFAFALASVSLMGLPPAGGFVAKWLLVEGALAEGQWGWALLVVAGGLLAAAYLFRVMRLFVRHAGTPGVSHHPPLGWALNGPPMALALAAQALGLGAEPLLALLAIAEGGP
ncbi:complex I subunit 5 family protein [Alkalilimnicola ehrlichii MLHE-1]|uniref:Multisubunit sodium/proton antiporter, MrpD subunit n=1 Tax=Alkalilimnicola ehrlichii (strain ATCC BAA-1101 / DSM 17681 / MLHE-1) TaxID=187272 RepID=Q0AAP0_ALKEH|nr:proton-conducting transporter membrane subunit [Alkalilimnicola ehrlichii]ABI56097.1 multisubunit sodium/proton antiporter, MrpD subunit [Alkalilimnicola ehrlichii MLHE-1]